MEAERVIDIIVMPNRSKYIQLAWLYRFRDFTFLKSLQWKKLIKKRNVFHMDWNPYAFSVQSRDIRILNERLYWLI